MASLPTFHGAPRAGLIRGEIPAIPCPSRVAAPASAPPPGRGAPPGRGVLPRPTGAGPTGARDFTTTGRESGCAD